MGHIKPEDRTTLAASAFAIITGLVAIGGGIAGMHYAEEASDRQVHSGDIAYAGGVTAIVGGITATLGGISAVVLKLHEIHVRDDTDTDATTHQLLQDLIAKLEALGRHVNVDLQAIQHQQPQAAAQIAPAQV